MDFVSSEATKVKITVTSKINDSNFSTWLIVPYAAEWNCVSIIWYHEDILNVYLFYKSNSNLKTVMNS